MNLIIPFAQQPFGANQVFPFNFIAVILRTKQDFDCLTIILDPNQFATCMKISKSFYRFVLFTALILIASCSDRDNNDSAKHTSFNFDDTVRIDDKMVASDSTRSVLRIAVAAISSPRETFAYYKEMFKYIEAQTGMKVVMIQRKTYEEINKLSKSNQIDIAFICSGGYVYGLADSSFNLLVIPERNGLKKYQRKTKA